MDNDLNVVYWSDAAERIFGWQREEFLGRSILIRLPSELHDYVSQTMRAIREGAPHLPSEFEDYRKSGSRVWVSRLLDARPSGGSGRSDLQGGSRE